MSCCRAPVKASRQKMIICQPSADVTDLTVGFQMKQSEGVTRITKKMSRWHADYFLSALISFGENKLTFKQF